MHTRWNNIAYSMISCTSAYYVFIFRYIISEYVFLKKKNRMLKPKLTVFRKKYHYLKTLRYWMEFCYGDVVLIKSFNQLHMEKNYLCLHK